MEKCTSPSPNFNRSTQPDGSARRPPIVQAGTSKLKAQNTQNTAPSRELPARHQTGRHVISGASISSAALSVRLRRRERIGVRRSARRRRRSPPPVAAPPGRSVSHPGSGIPPCCQSDIVRYSQVEGWLAALIRRVVAIFGMVGSKRANWNGIRHSRENRIRQTSWQSPGGRGAIGHRQVDAHAVLPGAIRRSQNVGGVRAYGGVPGIPIYGDSAGERWREQENSRTGLKTPPKSETFPAAPLPRGAGRATSSYPHSPSPKACSPSDADTLSPTR